MTITYKYRGDLPLNTENNKNQNQSAKNSERRGMLKGCGGCLISFILLIILLSACSMMFSNNDNSTTNKSSKTQLTQKDENKNEDESEEKSESETDEDSQTTEEVPANENTEKNQHEIDEITTKDQSDDKINSPNVAEESQDNLKDDFKEKQQSSDHHQSTQPKTSPTPEVNTQKSFSNCTELRKVYPNGVSIGHPAYHPSLDRDKDNRACEPDKY
ncbi:TPA: excalibur calcium-binding domain-containing protein [Staphylococcus aureus]|nr:excalibur calcium-binding domain-containing protein [Staphylococcus aureus]HDJ2986112.1 excalibur calcium-binding domain-containing protein [Staphylococcus aureus]HDJ3209925.1 excalibur calcium-binding domain-containing protein [Staphylococcus aureus]